jgi:hypothetical protein
MLNKQKDNLNLGRLSISEAVYLTLNDLDTAETRRKKQIEKEAQIPTILDDR